MKRPESVFAAGIALIETALADERVLMAQSEARIATLRAAMELEQAGRRGEAAKLVRQVEREQRRTRVER